ncbi:MAG: DUF5691 domain-containing protein [Anaerolineae bacterium]|nr:DUF5691 domain-containing protein [Anaerolineae bacterium]
MNIELIEQLWQKVLTAGLLGTERQPLASLHAEGTLGDIFKRLDFSDAESALLNAAVTLSYVQRAASMPIAPLGRALPLPCPPDPQPAVSRQAAELLKVLDARRPHLFEEWLHLAFERGVRVSEEYIPELLNLGEQVNPALSALVAGVRGRWLAALVGGKWIYAAFQLDDDSAWRTGAPLTRKTFLSALRLTAPERARQLLEETWERESAERRADLLGTLIHNLSEADLPFLKRVAQTDRVLSLRETAADFINQLSQPLPLPSQREAEALPLFSLARPWSHSEYTLLFRCDHAWSAEFSLSFAEYLPQFLARQVAPNGALWLDHSFPSHFEPLLTHLHPRAIERTIANLESLGRRGAVWRNVAEWQAILRLRAAIHAAF